MILNKKHLILIACLFFAGCASSVREAGNPIKNEQLSTARIVFEAPTTLPLTYGMGQLGSQELALKSAKNSIEPLARAIHAHVPHQVRMVLAKKGIFDGNETTIYIKPLHGYVVGGGTKIALEIRVGSSDKLKPVWSVRILGGSEVRGSAERNAEAFTSKIVDELAKAGFIPL